MCIVRSIESIKSFDELLEHHKVRFSAFPSNSMDGSLSLAYNRRQYHSIDKADVSSD